MELCFDAILYYSAVTCNLNFLWAITNVHAGCIWPTGHRFPTPGPDKCIIIIMQLDTVFNHCISEIGLYLQYCILVNLVLVHYCFIYVISNMVLILCYRLIYFSCLELF